MLLDFWRGSETAAAADGLLRPPEPDWRVRNSHSWTHIVPRSALPVPPCAGVGGSGGGGGAGAAPASSTSALPPLPPSNIKVYEAGRQASGKRVVAETVVQAPVDVVWRVLTNYERLAEFVPNLESCERLPSPRKDKVSWHSAEPAEAEALATGRRRQWAESAALRSQRGKALLARR